MYYLYNLKMCNEILVNSIFILVNCICFAIAKLYSILSMTIQGNGSFNVI